MNAVESGASCCHWFPCATRGAAEGGLKNRVCLHWRIIPGLITLVACIIAVVCSLLWDCPYMCFGFVPGIIASTYLIYLGWDFQNLKSFAENNQQLEESIQIFQTENEELSNKLKTFEEENKKLQESSNNLSSLVDNLKSENLNLTNSNEDLKKTVQALEELKKTLGEKAGRHLEQLAHLERSLTGIEASVKEDHTTFAAHLQTFVQEVQSLQDTRTNFEKIGSVVEEKMKEQVDILLKAAKMLTIIFTQINDWKDNEVVELRIKQQQLLNDQLRTLENQLSKSDGRIEEQKRQIEELAKLKTGFGTALADLLAQIANLKEVKGELAAETEKVKQAARIFQNYDFQHFD